MQIGKLPYAQIADQQKKTTRGRAKGVSSFASICVICGRLAISLCYWPRGVVSLTDIRRIDRVDSDYPLKDETYRLIGACFEVYNEKGCGVTEPIYQECLEIELRMQEIPFASQRQLALCYKGHRLTRSLIPDFFCFDKVILEIKAVSALTDEHRAQVLNYLNAAGFEIGLLVNFGHYPKLEYERIINRRKAKRPGEA